MQLDQLRSFLAIAREQNLTRASEALNLSQSAVSSRIKLLEEELGLRLFERTSRSMQLTEAGQVLASYARDVLRAAEELKQKAVSLSHGLSASIVVGLNTDATFLRVSAINQRIRSLLADTSLTFRICHSADTARQLHQGQIDLGFFYGDELLPGVESRVVKQVRICVVIPTSLVPDGEPLNWGRVAALPWVWVDNEFPFFKLLQQNIEDHVTLPNQTVTAVDEQIVRELVAAGHGAAIMREDEARPLAEKGLVTIWNKGWGEIPLRLGWLEANSNKQRLKTAIDAICHIWEKPAGIGDGDQAGEYWY